MLCRTAVLTQNQLLTHFWPIFVVTPHAPYNPPNPQISKVTPKSHSKVTFGLPVKVTQMWLFPESLLSDFYRKSPLSHFWGHSITIWGFGGFLGGTGAHKPISLSTMRHKDKTYTKNILPELFLWLLLLDLSFILFVLENHPMPIVCWCELCDITCLGPLPLSNSLFYRCPIWSFSEQI